MSGRDDLIQKVIAHQGDRIQIRNKMLPSPNPDPVTFHNKSQMYQTYIKDLEKIDNSIHELVSLINQC